MQDNEIDQHILDQIFSLTPLRDRCIDAANRAARSFDNSFPGWQLYSRLVRGDTQFDPEIYDWASMGAWALARATMERSDGIRLHYVRKSAWGDWITMAGHDAMTRFIGEPVPSPADRAAELGIGEDKLRRIHDPVLGMIRAGFTNYRAELHTQFWNVAYDERRVGRVQR